MVKFLLGAAVGYVLGSKAGRGRYEQIKRTYHKVADHPAVQTAAGVARAKVSEKVPFIHEPSTNGSRPQDAEQPS